MSDAVVGWEGAEPGDDVPGWFAGLDGDVQAALLVLANAGWQVNVEVGARLGVEGVTGGVRWVARGPWTVRSGG